MSGTAKLEMDTIRLRNADAFYERLIDTVQHMPERDALKTMVKLSLILANQVGDDDVLAAALDAAVAENQA